MIKNSFLWLEKNTLFILSQWTAFFFRHWKIILHAWRESARELLAKLASASTKWHSHNLVPLLTSTLLISTELSTPDEIFVFSSDRWTQSMLYMITNKTCYWLLANCRGKMFTDFHRLRGKGIFLFNSLLVFIYNGHNSLYEIWLKIMKRNTKEIRQISLKIRKYFGLKPHQLLLLK